jgi:hypothetical protein
MSQHISSEQLAQFATLTEAPGRTRVERNFGLPTGLYQATAGLYLAFIGLMSLLFGNPELAIPLVVIAGFIVIAFSLAGLWTTMKPDNDSSPLSWGQFSTRGIQTLSGPLTAGEASAQVLTLPVLILFWGASVALIVALT